VCPNDTVSLFAVDTKLGTPGGTTIVDIDNQMILKVNLEDLLDDQKTLIEQAIEEFREKCLLSYSRTCNSVIQKTPLPSILLHGQSEDIEARTTAHLVHKTIYEAFINHKKVLVNTIDNVLKEVFFGAPVDQMGPAYFNAFNPLAMENNIPGSIQKLNGGQFLQPPM
jgi:hypothetical protein